MDFDFSELQRETAGLAADVLTRRGASDGAGSDAQVWDRLCETGLLGVGLPEELGGSGGGMMETCVLLEQLGRHASSLSALPALVAAATIARFGPEPLRDRSVKGFPTGDTTLSAALRTIGILDPRHAPVVAERGGDEWLLTGAAATVPAADGAHAIVVAARTGGSVGLFVVTPAQVDLTLTPQVVTSRETEFLVELDATPAEALVVGDAGTDAAAWVARYALVGLCALQAGLAAGAIELTAGYLAERVQFGRPLATFQSAQHRLADAHIAAQALRWTMWRAATALDDADPRLPEFVAISAFWGAEAATRILEATQHLHGGMGIDTSYPLHRYVLGSKRVELAIGAASSHVQELGRLEAQRMVAGEAYEVEHAVRA